MRILIICSYNTGKVASYIEEQTEWLSNSGIETGYFLIKGRGITGYLSQFIPLLRQIQLFKPDLIHAHYGLSGLLAVMQQRIPVITTFHGSDINYSWNRFLSRIAMKYSAWSVFVSEKLALLAGAKKNYSIISCGINLCVFYPVDKNIARGIMGLPKNENLILFSGSFSNKVKNYPLAKAAVSYLNVIEKIQPPVKLIELKDYSRDEVNLMLNACDVALLTSFTEGSPNFIKEALACNRPIVATDVGDIREMIGNSAGCYIASFETQNLAQKIKTALSSALKYTMDSSGRKRIIEIELEADKANRKLLSVFQSIKDKSS